MVDIMQSIGSFNWTGVGSTMGTMMLWIMGIAIVGLLVYFIYWYFSFKHTVLIKRRVGKIFELKMDKYYEIPDDRKPWEFWKPVKEKQIVYIDQPPTIENVPYTATLYRARIRERKGVKYLQLMYVKNRMKIPDNVYQNMTWKGKLYIEMVQISEHIYWPTALSNNNTMSIVPDESYLDWVANDMENDYQKYRNEASWWEKYGNWVMTAGLLMIIMIMLYLAFKDLKEVTQMIGSYSNAMIETAKAWNQCAGTQVV